MIKTFQDCVWSSCLSCLQSVGVTPMNEAFSICVICIFNYVKSEVNEIWLNEFLFHPCIKMSFRKLTACWNYCNPGELLLMRQHLQPSSCQVQIPGISQRRRILIWKKSKWKKKTSELHRNPSWKPPLSSSKLNFLLFVLWIFFREFWNADVYLLLFHNPVLFCDSPFKVLPAKFFPKQFGPFLFDKQCVDFSSSLQHILIGLK